MIVLGPRDADLGGAPDYWREGFWRPDTLLRGPQTCAFTAIPFDKCDVVLEYDARRPERPMPADQNWKLTGEDNGIWKHDPRHGVLTFDPEGKTPSFWQAQAEREMAPDRGAAYGLFLISQSAAELREGGLDFIFQAPAREGRMRGMRGCYSSLWHWRALDGSAFRPIIKAAVEPGITQVWHRFGMDAELNGAEIRLDNFDRDDGGKTIGSLDGLISNEDRRVFLYGPSAPRVPAVSFGLTDKETRVSGMIRNYVASFPGVFLRPAFRAIAPGEKTRLRLIFCRPPGNADATASFQVRYTSPSLGMHGNALPDKEAPPASLQFDPGAPGVLAEITVPLDGVLPGEPLWFTVERDWRSDEDKLRDTVHLLSLILEEER